MAKKKEVEPTPLDRFVELRKNVGTGHVMTELLDILIDAHGGDSEAVRAEIAEAAETTQTAAEQATSEVGPETETEQVPLAE